MEPTAQKLAELFPGTMHTRWGRTGFHGEESTVQGPDFVCLCDYCAGVRLRHWRKLEAKRLQRSEAGEESYGYGGDYDAYDDLY